MFREFMISSVMLGVLAIGASIAGIAYVATAFTVASIVMFVGGLLVL